MAAPQIRSSSIGTNHPSGSTFTMAYPTGIQAGDVLVLFYLSERNYVSGTPDTWNLITGADPEDDGYYADALWWKLADGTETGNITMVESGSDSQTIGICVAVSGCDETNPIEHFADNYGLVAPSVTAAGPDRLLYSIVGAVGIDSLSFTVPSGMTLVRQGVAQWGWRMGASAQQNVGAGPTGTRTWASTPNSGDRITYSILLQPPGAPPEPVGPTVSAGSDRVGLTSEPVVIVGTATPGDNPITSTQWSVTDPGTTGLTNADITNRAALATEITTKNLPGVATLELKATDTASLSATDTMTVTVQNRPPVANAGPNQAVIVGTVVNLDGTGSSDPEGGPLAYAWTVQNAGGTGLTTGQIQNRTTATPSFTAPATPGSIVLQLEVTDQYSAKATATVTISTSAEPEPVPPTANAGPDRTIKTSEIASLSGSATAGDAPIGSTLWSIVSAGTTGLTNADIADRAALTTTVTAKSSPGAAIFELKVTDTDNLTDTDTMTVTVQNRPPVADAGSNKVATTGTVVNLDGSGSFDPEGGPLSYLWSVQNAGGTGLTNAQITGRTTVTPSFTAPATPGTITMLLTVTDQHSATATDTMTVTTSVAPPKQPPTVNAGTNKTVKTGEVASLSGSVTPGDAPVTSTLWSITDPGATGLTNADITNRSALSTVLVTGNKPGVVVVELKATDSNDLVDTDTVTITVENRPPVAHAGNPQTVQVDGFVQLNGTGSVDPEGGPLTYDWTVQNDGGTGLVDTDLTGRTTAEPTFTAPDTPGVITLQLTVTDQYAGTGTAVTTVTVVPTGEPTGEWKQIRFQADSPSGSAWATLAFEDEEAEPGETHYFDRAMLSAGVTAEWSRGGIVNATHFEVEFSDDDGQTWVPLRNAEAVEPDDAGRALVSDHEYPLLGTRMYRVRAWANIE